MLYIAVGPTYTIESDNSDGVVNLWRTRPSTHHKMEEITDNGGIDLLVVGMYYDTEFLYQLAAAYMNRYLNEILDKIRWGQPLTIPQLEPHPETPLYPVG